MANVLTWLLFIALIVAAVLIYMRVAKPEIWNSWKSVKQLPYQARLGPFRAHRFRNAAYWQ
jgi:hypothetical protein